MLFEVAGLIACTAVWGVLALVSLLPMFLARALLLGRLRRPGLAMLLVALAPASIVVCVVVAWIAFFTDNRSLATTLMFLPLLPLGALLLGLAWWLRRQPLRPAAPPDTILILPPDDR